MQRAVLSALTSFCLLSGALADPASAAIRQSTNIPPEPLDLALKTLAKERQFQVLFRAEIVRDVRTEGAVGEFTQEEAIKQLLSGTGLAYKYLDANTVTVFAQAQSANPAPSGVAPHDGDEPTKEGKGKKDSSQDFRVAQVDQTPAGNQAVDTSQDQKPKKRASACDKPASGQDQVKESDAGLAEILVCGSHIMNVDVVRTENDVQPYTIFNAQQIEQSGATNIEDFLKQQLTMNTAAQTSAQSFTPTNGTTSSINLRGLGSNETLILIDGRRSAGVSIFGNTNQPDINGIPLAAIERIEVLPSSASAIYGGAAVGGVVNIILKRQFDGGDLSYTYDNPFSGHAPTQTINGGYGFSLAGGRTQFMLAGSYSDGTPLLVADRLDLVGRGILNVLQNSPSFLYSPSQPFLGATPNIASTDGTYNSNFTIFTPTPLTLRNGTPLGSPITYVPAGAAPGANISSALLANAGRYNLNLAPGTGQYGLQSPIEAVPLTKSLIATIRQSVFTDAQVFMEFSTRSNASRLNQNPFSQPLPVPSTAPSNPFQQDVLVTFPSEVAAPSTSDNVTQSMTVGATAPLAHGWKSEVDYTWSRNSFESAHYQSDGPAIDAALADGTLNPFVDTLAHPLNLSPYLAANTYSGDATLDDLSLRASGPVGELPAGHPTLTVGLEHRKEGSHDANAAQIYPVTTSLSYQEVLFGQSQSTDSVYAEGLVPLVGSQNEVPAIHALELQIAGRSERYRAFTGTPYAYAPPNNVFDPPQGVHATIEYTSTNPTIGLKYQPVSDLAFRTSFAKAFLPPTASELLPNPSPQCPGAVPCISISDPKNGETYNIDYSYGGNPNLKPQTSRDWDLGLIWEPQEKILQGLRVDLEYYRITQPNYIVLAPEFQQLVSDPAYSGRVTRDPNTGLITTVDDSPLNATEYKTSGFDLKLDYRKTTSFGTLGLHAAGTLIKYDQRQLQLGAPFLEYAGYPNDGGEGKIKANATLSWEYRGWIAAWTATYFSSYWQSCAPGSPCAIQFGPLPFLTDPQGANTIPSQTYHDVYASYTFETAGGRGVTDKLLSNTTVQFGIRNILNKLPPFDVFYGPYFYSEYGDPRLRDYRITVRKAF